MTSRNRKDSAPISDVREACRIGVEEVSHPALKALLARWLEVGRGGMPSRRAMSPEVVRGAVGRIMILQVEPGPSPTFRYRLVGTGIVDDFGLDMTGLNVGEFSSESVHAMLREHCETVCRERRPSAYRVHADRDYRSYGYVKIVLPLSEDGETVNQIVICSFPEQ